MHELCNAAFELATPPNCDIHIRPPTLKFSIPLGGCGGQPIPAPKYKPTMAEQNGCGIAEFPGLQNWLAGVGLPNYTNNLDAPFPGVAFSQACNSHDICYSSRQGQAWCDTDLKDDLLLACQSAGANSTSCTTLVNRMYSIVDDLGSVAYQSSSDAYICTLKQQINNMMGCAWQ